LSIDWTLDFGKIELNVIHARRTTYRRQYPKILDTINSRGTTNLRA